MILSSTAGTCHDEPAYQIFEVSMFTHYKDMKLLHYYYNHFTALWTMSGTTQMSRYQKNHSPTHTYRVRHLLDFLVQNENNTGRCTNNPDGLPPHPDQLVPPPLPKPFSCRMPFLAQPSKFFLAWDKHQICRLANLVARLVWLWRYERQCKM